MLSDRYADILLNECHLPLERQRYLADARLEYSRVLSETGKVNEEIGLGFVCRWGALNCAFYIAAHGAMKSSHFKTVIHTVLSDDKIMGEIAKGPDIFSPEEIAKRRAAAICSQAREHPNGWVYTIEPQTAPDKLAFTYTECCLCKMARAQGCEEILLLMCALDNAIYARRGVKMTRNHTLANGDGRCDFRLQKI